MNIGSTTIPYPAYVMLGTLLWQVFTDALNTPLRQVTTSKSMLAKINFPREALILTGLYEVLFNFSIRMILIIPVFVWFQIPLHPTIFLAPFGILAMILLGLAIGILICPLGILYEDVGRSLTILTSLWFFLTPVVYPPPTQWPFSLVSLINPVTPLITTTRDWLTLGGASQVPVFCFVLGGTLVLLFAGWMFYRLAMTHLIERMSA